MNPASLSWDPTRPFLSICIVSHGTRDVLADCLASIEANPIFGEPYEVLIVDNHSTDGTLEMLRRNFPWVKVVAILESNQGYTAPMNRALKAAEGQYLMQLNPDTLVQPGMIDCLVEFMETHPRVGICTPKVLNRDGTLQKQCRRSAARPWDTIAYMLRLHRLFPGKPKFDGYLMGYRDEDETFAVEAVSGSCMLIRREVVDQIGYLDEAFEAYQEDADFCFRARQAGWEIYYVPQAQVIHFGGQGGSLSDMGRSIRAWHRSYYLYYRKNLSKDYFFLFNWLYYGLMQIKLGWSLLSAWFKPRDYIGSPKP